MAKTSSINRNDKRRKMSKLADVRRKKLKALIMKKETPMDERFAAVLKLAEMPRNSAKVRIRNRCELTGRPRGFYRKVKLSRIALREMSNSGLIPGMVKSSW
ncbi:30S ribosomal protein S14 [Aestuariivirga litoralis]|uniref:30S ribosomal protein S14 n=1 Tax=Aestuariivirga litoralis TaxID=2650924 RepID=UPI0018C6AA12|nr:30S ribosomal protein S14 [Aestuariivirga litoralis]MBG1231523.1 30S ribosomal protein S14 [Aestuariivirga litoralis]